MVMLALLGLFGALMAGVVADMALVKAQPASDGDDDTAGPDDPEIAEDSAAVLAEGTSVLDFAVSDPAPAETGFDSSDTPALPVADLVLGGTDQPDILIGGAGNDSLAGAEAGDHLAGGLGADLLHGDAGRDTVLGEAGTDVLFGGEGNDDLQGDDGDDVVHGDAGHDELTGSSGNDLLHGGDGNDSLLGGEGEDTLDGGAGDDWLAGGFGNDVLKGGTGQDTLDGGDGDDTIWGMDPDDPDDGADFLNGGNGDDLLMIGSGDYANGNAGADVFAIGDWMDEAEFATIGDFDADEDEILVVYDAATHPDPTITFEPVPDSGDITLMLDGVPLALVIKGAGLDPSLVRLVSSEQIAA
jgi:Ca2+-binding RTX toxin-like protein